MTDDAHQTVTDIARKVRTAMITSTGQDGVLRSRPMTSQEVEFDGTAWFFVSRTADIVAEVTHHPAVNVAYAGPSSWLSLSGAASVVEDPARKKELWNGFVEAWFPDGADDPEVVLLKVDAASAEFWETPGGRPRALFEMAKARVTGGTPEPGNNDTVTM